MICEQPLSEKYVDLMLRKPDFNVCEQGHRPGSFGLPKHMFKLLDKKTLTVKQSNICISGPMMERHVITVMSKEV